jgi:GNAT superfamily N-acetyltransferase
MEEANMGQAATIREVMDILCTPGKPQPGITTREVGPLLWTHFDTPVWWETDSFRAIDVEPAEVVRIVKSCRPGPHLIRVVTTDPEGVIAPYAEIGYQTTPSERLETIMARSLRGYVRDQERYSVQLVRTEQQRCFYNTMISPDDGHGQMQPDALDDPLLRHYYVEMECLCVCYAKAIQRTPRAVVVEPLGTREGYCRRGIATALMDRLHADAAEHGAELSIIGASAMGVLLYTTLGYQVVAYVQKLVPQGFDPTEYR